MKAAGGEPVQQIARVVGEHSNVDNESIYVEQGPGAETETTTGGETHVDGQTPDEKAAARVLGYESRNFLSILDELHSDALSNGRVGLFGFDSDLLQHDSLNVRGPTERVGLQGRARVSLLVIFIGPSLNSAMGADLSRGFDSSWLSHSSYVLTNWKF